MNHKGRLLKAELTKLVEGEAAFRHRGRVEQLQQVVVVLPPHFRHYRYRLHPSQGYEYEQHK